MTKVTAGGVTEWVERAIRGGLLAVFAVGLRRRSPGAVVNAVVAWFGSTLPGFVEGRYGVAFRPWQRLYVESAMLTHAYGMLGPYEEETGWDHLTHTHSASIVGAAAYVLARRRGWDPTVTVLGGVGVLGLLWELLEYAGHAVANRLGFEPLLVPYGHDDTLLDLCFDALGALLVLVVGDRLLGNLVE